MNRKKFQPQFSTVVCLGNLENEQCKKCIGDVVKTHVLSFDAQNKKYKQWPNVATFFREWKRTHSQQYEDLWDYAKQQKQCHGLSVYQQIDILQKKCLDIYNKKR